MIRPTSLARVPPGAEVPSGARQSARRGDAGRRVSAGCSAWPKPRPRRGPRLIVLDSTTPVALEVDEVAALVTVAASELDGGDAGLSATAGEQLQGVFQTDGHVTKILDIAALLENAFPRNDSRRRVLSSAAPQRDEKAAVADDRRRLVTLRCGGTGVRAGSRRRAGDRHRSQPSHPCAGKRQEAVLGVMPYRERLLPLLSLRILLTDCRRHPLRAQPRVIVTTVGDTLVGLVADGTRSILAVDPDRVEQAPPVLSARAGGEKREDCADLPCRRRPIDFDPGFPEAAISGRSDAETGRDPSRDQYQECPGSGGAGPGSAFSGVQD